VPAVLACPACGTGLLARRGDPLCLTCVKAARTMAGRPLWLFDSLLLRQALAEVNLAAVPAIVRAACGLSQRDLAAIVGWSGAALSYYERGRRDGMFDIRSVLQFADAVGMPRAALLPLIVADAGAEHRPCAEWGRPGRDDVSSATVAAALPVAGVPRGVTSSHVRYWQVCAETLYIQDRAVSEVSLLSPALQQWRRVQLALRESGARELGSQLSAAAGELALCAGLIALDCGCLPMAQLLHGEADKLAADADDPVLTVHVLTSLSMLYAEMAEAGCTREPARRALRLAFKAQEEGRYIPVSRLHALIALRHASAASLLGDKTGFQAAIVAARRQLERGPRDDNPPEWLRFVGETALIGAEARGWLNLGEARRAVLHYRQILAGALTARERTDYMASLACALLRLGEPGDAVSVAMEVLPALDSEIASVRCLNQLRIVAEATGESAASRELRERFETIERALTAPDNLPGSEARLSMAGVSAL
jgi:hypothetical protein